MGSALMKAAGPSMAPSVGNLQTGLGQGFQMGSVIGGTTLGIMGTMRQSKAQQEAEMVNEALALQQAADARNRGSIEAAALLSDAHRQSQAQRTRAGASGVDTTVGSLMNAGLGTEVAGSIDAARIKSNAARQAWGFEVEADEHRRKRFDIKEAGVLGAVGQGLGGAGKLGSMLG